MFVKQHRLPTDPLFRFCGTDMNRHLAEHLGITENTVANWIRHGGVPDKYADHFAVKLGVHPSAIWGDAWFALAEKDLVGV